MSKELTEQCKNCQLESFRSYYVKFKTGEIEICWLTEWSNDELGTGGQYFDGIKEENILEVLSPVPTFEEWKELKEFADYSIHNRDELTKQINFWMQENTKLKELLKECKDVMQQRMLSAEEYKLFQKIEELDK